jgi:hypothetical protein
VSQELGLEEVGVTDEDYVDTTTVGVDRAGHSLSWGVVAPHCIEGDTDQGSAGLDYLAAAVSAALATGAMWQLWLATLLASNGAWAGHLPRSFTLPGPRARHLLLGHRHWCSPRSGIE